MYCEWARSQLTSLTGGLALDKAAANRFIKAAISEAKAASADALSKIAGSSSQSAGNVDVVVPFGKHTRFTHVKPPRNERPESSGENSDDDEVDVIDDVNSMQTGKEAEDKARQTSNVASSSTKRRRTMDPFAGVSFSLFCCSGVEITQLSFIHVRLRPGCSQEKVEGVARNSIMQTMSLMSEFPTLPMSTITPSSIPVSAYIPR